MTRAYSFHAERQYELSYTSDGEDEQRKGYPATTRAETHMKGISMRFAGSSSTISLSSPHSSLDRRSQFCRRWALMASDPAMHGVEQQSEAVYRALMALPRRSSLLHESACNRFLPFMHPASGKCLQARLSLFHRCSVTPLSFTSLPGQSAQTLSELSYRKSLIRVLCSLALLAVAGPCDSIVLLVMTSFLSSRLQTALMSTHACSCGREAVSLIPLRATWPTIGSPFAPKRH